MGNPVAGDETVVVVAGSAAFDAADVDRLRARCGGRLLVLVAEPSDDPVALEAAAAEMAGEVLGRRPIS